MIDQYVIQKVRMCVETYFKMNGTRPCMQEMVEWTGESAEAIRRVYLLDAGRTKAERAMAA